GTRCGCILTPAKPKGRPQQGGPSCVTIRFRVITVGNLRARFGRQPTVLASNAEPAMTEQKPARPTKRGPIIALACMAAVSAVIVPALAAKNSGPATPPPSTWAYTEPTPTPVLDDSSSAAPTVFTPEE